MLGAPRQDWQLFEAMSRAADACWIRSLSLADRYAIYANMFDVVWEARAAAGANARAEESHWREKLQLRQRVSSAYAKLDELRRERTAADHSG